MLDGLETIARTTSSVRCCMVAGRRAGRRAASSFADGGACELRFTIRRSRALLLSGLMSRRHADGEDEIVFWHDGGVARQTRAYEAAQNKDGRCSAEYAHACFNE